MSTVEEIARSHENGAAGAGKVAVENPATGELIAHVPDMGSDDVRALAERARAAQPGWEAMGFDGRARVMNAARRWLVDNRDRVARTIVEENGKTREDALLLEVMVTLEALKFWEKQSEKFLADERVRSGSPLLLGKKLLKRYRPHGVVGVIGPWNYPLANGFADCVPALMAGNSVILKPSEVTPLTSLLMAEGMKAAGLPEDVFLIATGRGETGAALVDHADMVHFTGSTRTGKQVMARGAETLTPVSLELGGKDPMIVLKDADVDRAANTAAYWALANGGQICMSIERVYVEEPIFDDFVEKVVGVVEKLRQGEPGAAGSVDIGAVTFPPQLDIIEEHVSDAVEKGAKVLVGGHRHETPRGRFYEPTVLVDVDHTMKVMTEETFGPTLPIMKVRDEEEAVRLANDSRYGLNSSVFTKDLDKGVKIARRLRAGNACVNDAVTNYGAHELPFGGDRESGIGVRHGAAGIQKYCRTQSILVTRLAGKKELYFFPYSPRRSALLERLMVFLYGRGTRKSS